jgi:hypothetical protein
LDLIRNSSGSFESTGKNVSALRTKYSILQAENLVVAMQLAIWTKELSIAAADGQTQHVDMAVASPPQTKK